MRKGADVLSKWVGEAERQLRLLFEEARNCQPSIIFFDEIDGLAPVRSSKQDQIHASIVSTLLALMDGMDGRGQVVVIGATNRPDAVDQGRRVRNKSQAWRSSQKVMVVPIYEYVHGRQIRLRLCLTQFLHVQLGPLHRGSSECSAATVSSDIQIE